MLTRTSNGLLFSPASMASCAVMTHSARKHSDWFTAIEHRKATLAKFVGARD